MSRPVSTPGPPSAFARHASAGKPARSAPPALTAWLTHIYTASGAAVAFLSLEAIVAGNLRGAFGWLVVALVVDASDGVLARAFRVHDRLPHVDGAHLDDIVDYLTYVFIPAFLLYHAGRLPAGWGPIVVFAILIASAIAFSTSDAKTADHFFTGFPSYWNIVAFYLYAFDTPAGVNGAVLLALCVMVFVRIGYVYPSRTPTLRTLTVVLGCAWGALLLYLLWQVPAINRRLLSLSLAFPVYYTALSLVLDARRRK